MKDFIISPNEFNKFQNCVITYGHFSTIHLGHMRYLRYSKEQGNLLVTALLPDLRKNSSSNYPFNQIERAESLAYLNIVDGIVLLDNNENSLINLLKKINPKVFILGKEFEKTKDQEIIDAMSFLKKNGVETKFHAGDINYSNSYLLEDSEKELINKQKEKFKFACKKQKIELHDLLDSINTWKNSRLIVFGDTIVDQYSACEALGMSAEAPVVVVKELNYKNFIGGAAIVASHIRALGAKCDFLSVVGNDEMADLSSEILSKKDIRNFLIKDKSRPTTFKKRYLVGNQKLFRVSRLEDHKINKEIEDKVINYFEQLSPNASGIVISDFSYGLVTNRILNKILSLSKKYDLMIFGDLQCSSQIGSITKFKNFSLLCPNEREARLSLMDKVSGLEKLSQLLISKTNTQRLIMKLGDDGFIAYDKDEKNQIISQSFPALSVNPVDVTGAGDSLLAIMSTGLSSKQSMMKTAAIGCCMASLAVGRMGNITISTDELINHLKLQFK